MMMFYHIPNFLNDCDIEDLLRPYGMVIIDECHHVPSLSFRVVLQQIRSKYIYGLSATPERQDGLEKLIYMYCGPKRYETNKRAIISARSFQQVLIPHFLNTKIFDEKLKYQELIEEVADNDNRNFFIANDIIEAFKKGKKIIVLSERISHLEKLYERVRDVSSNVFLYVGKLKQKEKKSLENQIATAAESQNFIVLATSKLLGEGFDLPVLDTLFLTLPIADKNRIEQYTGRIHREYKDKTEVQVHDYIDICIPVLDSMFQKRLKAYYREGYHLQEEKETREITSIVYYGGDYSEPLEKDLSLAKKQIIICMSSYNINKIKRMHSLLQRVSQKGIKINIVAENEKISEECKKYLIGAGCKLYPKKTVLSSNFIVIDKHTVWYGNSNIFGNALKSSTLIRLGNDSFAQELLDSIE